MRLTVMDAIKRGAAAAIALALLVGAALIPNARVRAQDAVAEPPAGFVRILVIDMERVRNESAVGRSIRADVSAFRQKAQRRYEAAQARFRFEDQALNAPQNAPATPERERRVAALRAELEAFKREQAEDAARINQFVSSARELINARVKAILETVMEERGAALVLHRHSVVATPSAFDVTRDVIERLDADPPAISLEQNDP